MRAQEIGPVGAVPRGHVADAEIRAATARTSRRLVRGAGGAPASRECRRRPRSGSRSRDQRRPHRSDECRELMRDRARGRRPSRRARRSRRARPTAKPARYAGPSPRGPVRRRTVMWPSAAATASASSGVPSVLPSSTTSTSRCRAARLGSGASTVLDVGGLVERREHDERTEHRSREFGVGSTSWKAVMVDVSLLRSARVRSERDDEHDHEQRAADGRDRRRPRHPSDQEPDGGASRRSSSRTRPVAATIRDTRLRWSSAAEGRPHTA